MMCKNEINSKSLKSVTYVTYTVDKGDRKAPYVSYIVAVAARWTKSLKFTLSIAVHRGGLAKNHFWLVATQKKRIGEQLNYF